MTRIRYRAHNVEKTVFHSVGLYPHPSTSLKYKTVLDTKESQWFVLEDVSGLIAASGHMTTMSGMKKQAKKALEALGVTFESEKRVREPKTVA